jgi:hypothetical protein
MKQEAHEEEKKSPEHHDTAKGFAVCIAAASQPIVINHWYFIRHLKRWMICANEISIIYVGRKRASARAGRHEAGFFLFFAPRAPTRKKSNLRFVFVVFYVRATKERASSRAGPKKRVRSFFGPRPEPEKAFAQKRVESFDAFYCFTTTTDERSEEGKFIQDDEERGKGSENTTTPKCFEELNEVIRIYDIISLLISFDREENGGRGELSRFSHSA